MRLKICKDCVNINFLSKQIAIHYDSISSNHNMVRLNEIMCYITNQKYSDLTEGIKKLNKIRLFDFGEIMFNKFILDINKELSFIFSKINDYTSKGKKIRISEIANDVHDLKIKFWASFQTYGESKKNFDAL